MRVTQFHVFVGLQKQNSFVSPPESILISPSTQLPTTRLALIADNACPELLLYAAYRNVGVAALSQYCNAVVCTAIFPAVPAPQVSAPIGTFTSVPEIGARQRIARIRHRTPTPICTARREGRAVLVVWQWLRSRCWLRRDGRRRLERRERRRRTENWWESFVRKMRSQFTPFSMS